LKRVLALSVAATVAASVLTVGSLVSPSGADRAEAVGVGAVFDPGQIISDADMFDFTRMTTPDIQSFLSTKGSGCVSTGSTTCLKDYRADTHDVAAVPNRCTGDIEGRANQTAAEIIYAVAVACEVNPQALIVTLQKEQGLVTATAPTASKYKIAMGYGCPDTAPCDAEYFGFFNQMYQAAYAFNKYTKSPSQYPAYQPGTRKIQYHPKKSCGTLSVTIKNKATTALYTYTPYVPNAAALANPYATGDSCSSYGNRNFWQYFNDWFPGTNRTDPYFVRNADSKQIYLIIDGKRRPVDSKHEMRLIAESTGIPYKLPSVQGSVVSSIGRGSTQVLVPGSVVKSSKKSKSLWLIDGLSTKRKISANQAIEITGSSSADVVSSKVIAGYTTASGSARLGLRVGERYWIADKGVLRRIRPQEVQHYKAKFGFGRYDMSTIAALDTGLSIGRLIKYDGKYYLVRTGTKIPISTAKYKKFAHELGKKAQPVDRYFAGLLPTRK
jgi:hypothetical protein